MKNRTGIFVAVLAAIMSMASAPAVIAQEPASALSAQDQEITPAVIGSGAQALYGLAPQLVEGNSTESLVEFELPEECTVHTKRQKLRCGGVDFDARVAAVDGDGTVVPTELKLTDAGFVVQVPQTPEGSETVAVAPFIAASTNEGQLDDAADAMETMLVSDASASGAVAFAAIARPAKVNVPSNYIYNPNTKVNKSLHDYCTWSPNSLKVSVKGSGRTYVTLTADFRGPCAIHDMCIERIIKQGGAMESKRKQRRHCDNTFRSRLQQNCSYTFYETRSASARNVCYSRASLYYSAVSAKTNIWNGR